MTGSLKQRIVTSVADDLGRIETALEANLTPELDLVGEIAGHILFAGGKRLRPLLAVLVHRALGGTDAAIYDVAGIFEYLHAATLIHDDVVDEAVARRGKTAAHIEFGAAEAVLTGDFLLARSLVISARTKNSEIIHTIATVTEEMAQGEIEQLRNKGDITLTEAAYDRVIERKTAVLIRGACKTGALLANADAAQVAAICDYGTHLGMAFQMADDLLDYTADFETLGKKPGADLREGKATLPVIRMLETASEADREFLLSVIGTGFSESDFSRIHAMLVNSGGIAYTEERARRHVAEAKAAISRLPESPETELLGLLADYALTRKS